MSTLSRFYDLAEVKISARWFVLVSAGSRGPDVVPYVHVQEEQARNSHGRQSTVR